MRNIKSGKTRNRLCLAFLLTIILSLTLTGCGLFPSADQNKENEIRLRIQLDLKEDIGLLVIDASYDGIETSGGISNVDKTMLKKDELLDWTIDKQFYENANDTGHLKLRLRVVTEYCDPNYDNIYPEELVVLLEPIEFDASFGESYEITITGSHAEGYQATLEEP